MYSRCYRKQGGLLSCECAGFQTFDAGVGVCRTGNYPCGNIPSRPLARCEGFVKRPASAWHDKFPKSRDDGQRTAPRTSSAPTYFMVATYSARSDGRSAASGGRLVDLERYGARLSEGHSSLIGVSVFAVGRRPLESFTPAAIDDRKTLRGAEPDRMQRSSLQGLMMGSQRQLVGSYLSPRSDPADRPGA